MIGSSRGPYRFRENDNHVEVNGADASSIDGAQVFAISLAKKLGAQVDVMHVGPPLVVRGAAVIGGKPGPVWHWATECSACRGRGKVVEAECYRCAGLGYRLEAP